MKREKARYEIREDYASDHYMIKDTNFYLVDFETGYSIARFVGTFDGASETGAKDVTISPGGKTVVVTNHNGSKHRYFIEELKETLKKRRR